MKANSRTNDIIVQNIGDEVLIYDLKINKALSLNETAAKVWECLDGQRTIEEIAQTTNIPLDLVLLSIDELQRNNLLQEKIETGLASDRVSRRKMMMRFASAAVALPIIIGIAAPTAISAQSCFAATTMNTVGFGGACASGFCPSVCGSFDSRCCSNMNNYAGTCTDDGGGLGVAVCDCVCA
ncbi:MAG: PqqD family protein [Pyrinomonadaceae bacterium]|nr:PqqD family protein [Pyrinomonadaceae bacterium]